MTAAHGRTPCPARARGVPVVPDDVAAALRGLVAAIPHGPGQARESMVLDHYLARLHAAGWYWESLDIACGYRGVVAHGRARRADGMRVPREVLGLPTPSPTPDTPRQPSRRAPATRRDRSRRSALRGGTLGQVRE